jgi:hypothetical protein
VAKAVVCEPEYHLSDMVDVRYVESVVDKQESIL